MATAWSDRERTIVDHETVRRGPPLGQLVRHLQVHGFTSSEAANLTARYVGLGTTRSGWTIRQVEHLVFIRAIVASGRLAR